MFDLTGDQLVDREDLNVWVEDLKHTHFGDANLDGEFNSSDLLRVFISAKFTSDAASSWGVPWGDSVGWSEGDWNADGVESSVKCPGSRTPKPAATREPASPASPRARLESGALDLPSESQTTRPETGLSEPPQIVNLAYHSLARV